MRAAVRCDGVVLVWKSASYGSATHICSLCIVPAVLLSPSATCNTPALPLTCCQSPCRLVLPPSCCRPACSATARMRSCPASARSSRWKTFRWAALLRVLCLCCCLLLSLLLLPLLLGCCHACVCRPACLAFASSALPLMMHQQAAQQCLCSVCRPWVSMQGMPCLAEQCLPAVQSPCAAGALQHASPAECAACGSRAAPDR